MKRLIFLALAFLPVALFGQAADRDMLLTQDGTLYTIESVQNDGSLPADVQFFLRLTIQASNAKPQVAIVPDSLTPGFHRRPALAYDADSRTLFIFWLKAPNLMSSELLLCSYRDGTWQPAVSIGSQPFHLEFNLRVATTHRLAQVQPDGSLVDTPILLVHAVWWDQTGYGETARYGLFEVQNGAISSIYLDDLSNFLSSSIPPYMVDPNFNPEILRHPALIDNGTADSIDVIFGDMRTFSISRMTLKPVLNGRIHIPIGVAPVGPPIGAPRSFSADWSGQVSTITSAHDGRFLISNATQNSVSFIMYANGAWSPVNTLPLSEKLSAEGAAAVLARMLNQ